MNNIVAFPGVDLDRALKRAELKASIAKRQRPIERDQENITSFLNDVDGEYLMIGWQGSRFRFASSGSSPALIWMLERMKSIVLGGRG